MYSQDKEVPTQRQALKHAENNEDKIAIFALMLHLSHRNN